MVNSSFEWIKKVRTRWRDRSVVRLRPCMAMPNQWRMDNVGSGCYCKRSVRSECNPYCVGTGSIQLSSKCPTSQDSDLVHDWGILSDRLFPYSARRFLPNLELPHSSFVPTPCVLELFRIGRTLAKSTDSKVGVLLKFSRVKYGKMLWPQAKMMIKIKMTKTYKTNHFCSDQWLVMWPVPLRISSCQCCPVAKKRRNGGLCHEFLRLGCPVEPVSTTLDMTTNQKELSVASKFYGTWNLWLFQSDEQRTLRGFIYHHPFNQL